MTWTFPNITNKGNPVSENKAKPKVTPHGVTVSAKNDDDSKIEARTAELVITHKAETELLKKSFEDQILSLIEKTKENKIHIESTVMDFNAKLATKSETRDLTATVIASEYVEHQTIANEYRKKMANALNNGQVIINLVDDNLYSRGFQSAFSGGAPLE